MTIIIDIFYLLLNKELHDMFPELMNRCIMLFMECGLSQVEDRTRPNYYIDLRQPWIS